MATRKFKTDLSIKGIDNLVNELQAYKKDVLQFKIELLVSRLADVGIVMATSNVGDFKNFITFTKQITPKQNGCSGLMLGYNSATNESVWYTQEGEKRAVISSILMAEFGSGVYAVKGHRGTFPNQTHAFQDSWKYATEYDAETGKCSGWVTTSGIEPTMPMYKASLEMRAQIKAIVNEVFSS